MRHRITLRGFAKMLFRRENGFLIGIGGNIASGRGGKFFRKWYLRGRLRGRFAKMAKIGAPKEALDAGWFLGKRGNFRKSSFWGKWRNDLRSFLEAGGLMLPGFFFLRGSFGEVFQ